MNNNVISEFLFEYNKSALTNLDSYFKDLTNKKNLIILLLHNTDYPLEIDNIIQLFELIQGIKLKYQEL